MFLIKLLALLIISLVLETEFLSRFTFFHGWIDLLLVLVVIWAAVRGEEEGLLMGFGVGFLQDVFTLNFFSSSLSFMLLGFGVGFLKKHLDQEEYLYIAGSAFLGTSFVFMVNNIIFYFVFERWLSISFLSLILTSLANAFMAILFTPLILRLNAGRGRYMR